MRETKGKLKKTVISVLIAVVLTVGLFMMSGCAGGLPGSAKKAIENSKKNWENAAEKTVRDVYTVTNLKIDAPLKKPLPIDINVMTLSAIIDVTRSFSETATSITAKISLLKLDINQLVQNQIKDIKLNTSKANKVEINASIALEGENIAVNISSKGLADFVKVKNPDSGNFENVQNIDFSQQYTASEQPQIAAVMNSSLDINSVGEIPHSGKMYKEDKRYDYTLAKEDSLSEISRQFSMIFDVVKEMSFEGGGKPIKDVVYEIFETSDLATILSKFIIGRDMPVKVMFNDEKTKYYISEISTNCNIGGAIKEKEFNSIMNAFGISLEGTGVEINFDKGILISTSNDSGLKINSTYEITKF